MPGGITQFYGASSFSKVNQEGLNLRFLNFFLGSETRSETQYFKIALG
jgi:hypothetical protein